MSKVLHRRNKSKVIGYTLEELLEINPGAGAEMLVEAREARESALRDIGVEWEPLSDEQTIEGDVAEEALYCAAGCHLGLEGDYREGLKDCPHQD